MLQNLRIGLKKRRSGKSECAREAAWKLAKSIVKLKENKAVFFSPSENRYLPAPFNLNLEEREFVVDFGAAMHTISKKDLNSVELDTLTKVCSPTTVKTADGEVLTHEEATVYVKEMEIFLTMKVLEETPAVYRPESFAMNMDTHVSGSTIKNHISWKTVFGYSVTRRTSFRSWFLVCQRVLPPTFPPQQPWHFQDRRLIILHFLQALLPHQQWLGQATVGLEHGKTWVE